MLNFKHLAAIALALICTLPAQAQSKKKDDQKRMIDFPKKEHAFKLEYRMNKAISKSGFQGIDQKYLLDEAATKCFETQLAEVKGALAAEEGRAYSILKTRLGVSKIRFVLVDNREGNAKQEFSHKPRLEGDFGHPKTLVVPFFLAEKDKGCDVKRMVTRAELRQDAQSWIDGPAAEGGWIESDNPYSVDHEVSKPSKGSKPKKNYVPKREVEGSKQNGTTNKDFH